MSDEDPTFDEDEARIGAGSQEVEEVRAEPEVEEPDSR
jgi:hypothetical protein